jgi:acyl carrier protein
VTTAPKPGNAPDREAVERRVRTLASECLGVNEERLTASTDLARDLGVDELDLVELVMEVEEEFEITIGDDEAIKIRALGDVVDCVVRALARGGPRPKAVPGERRKGRPRPAPPGR